MKAFFPRSRTAVRRQQKQPVKRIAFPRKVSRVHAKLKDISIRDACSTPSREFPRDAKGRSGQVRHLRNALRKCSYLADALGFLADLSCAWRAAAVARA